MMPILPLAVRGALLSTLIIVVTSAHKAQSETRQKQPRYLADQSYQASLKSVAGVLVVESKTATEKIWATMEFVYGNSVHKIDDEHRNLAFNRPVVVERMLRASKGEASIKPHLSCGPRSYIMRDILTQFKITSRLVQVFSDDFETVAGHRLLEVFNPDTESWETWDPDNGVVYVSTTSSKRLDIISLLVEDLDRVSPISKRGKGWITTKTQHLKKHYFEAVLFETFKDGNEGLLNGIVIVNSNRFNLEKLFKDGANFTTWARRNYIFPRIIPLKF